MNITVSNLSDWKALAFGKSYSALLLARAILKFKLLKDLDVNNKSGFLLLLNQTMNLDILLTFPALNISMMGLIAFADWSVMGFSVLAAGEIGAK